MTAIPLLIAAASLGYSLILPESDGSRGTSSSTRPLSSVSKQSVFGFGVVLGMGLSSLINYELTRRRIWDKVRLFLLDWGSRRKDPTLKGQARGEIHRRPTLLETIQATLLPSTPLNRDETASISPPPSGILQKLLSPEWALTSSLSVCVLTLQPKTALIDRPAPGVECYYVLQGQGFYRYRSQDGENSQSPTTTTTTSTTTTVVVSPGMSWIVDPGSIRSLEATGSSQLQVLRATDAGVQEETEDSVCSSSAPTTATTTTSTTALVRVGLEQVEALVQRYSSKTNGWGGTPEMANV